MAQFTIFSLVVTIFWVSIFAKAISLLRKQMLLLKYFSLSPLLILLLFCILRLFFPGEWPFTIIINSQKVLPFIQSFLCASFFKVGSIKVSLTLIISVVWVLGTVYNILKHVRNYHHFKHFLDRIPETDDKHLYNIFSMVCKHRSLANIKIIVHDSIKSPAIFGFVRPVMLLPNINFSDDELFSIFIHESTHYYFGHAIIKYITEFICACFWWNPLFKELSLEMTHVLEMHSDKAVCKKTNAKQQMNYLACITKVANNINSPTSFPSTICGLVEGKNEEKLRQRFKMILDGHYQSKKRYDFLIIPIIIVMFLISYSIVLQPYSLPSQEHIGSSEEINSDWYLVEFEEGYILYDSTNKFIAKIVYIDESLSGLKIYNNLEDVK